MCLCVAAHMVIGVPVAVGCVVPPFADGGDFGSPVVVKAIIVVCADSSSLCPAR